METLDKTKAAHGDMPCTAPENSSTTTAALNKQCKGTTFSPNMQIYLPKNTVFSANTPENEPILPDTLPIWALPDDVQQMIETYTAVYQCPRDFVTAAALVTAGAAAGTKQTADDGKYKNTPCLWICNVAPSGSNKSRPVAKVMAPLDRLNADIHHQWQKEYREWQHKCEQAKYAHKKQKEPQPLELPDKPIHPQILMGDTTPEARNRVLADNPHGILLYSDELRTFFDNIGRYNSGGELSQILSIYDNDNIQINRKTDTEQVLYIDRPYMCLLGGIQPDILQRIFDEQMCTNGLLFRFNFVYPEHIELPDYANETIPNDIFYGWDKTIENIYNMQPTNHPLTDDALETLVQYDNARRHRWNMCTDAYTRGVLGKQMQHIERIALIVAVLRGTAYISADCIRYAIECVGYFERTMQRVRQNLSQSIQSAGKRTKTQVLADLFAIYPELDAHKTELSRWLGKSDGYIRKLLNDSRAAADNVEPANTTAYEPADV